MGKKDITIEGQLKKYKRRFFIVLSVLAVFVASTAFYIYLNYDYLVFKHFISQHYIYTNALDELYKKELNRDVKGRYYSYFDDVVISVVTRSIRGINNDRYTYLFTPEGLKKYEKEEKDDASMSEIKVLNSRTVYLHLTNFSNYTKKFMQDNAKKLGQYPDLIVDLRDNYGGDIDVMSYISDMFLPKKSTIAVDKMRFINWTYKAKGNKDLSYKKILILQNRNTASASENFIAALKDNLNNVTLIGETTFGKGIGQFTMPLRRGFAVKATVLLWYTPKGTNIQGKGIKPDIPYTGEDILQFALNMI